MKHNSDKKKKVHFKTNSATSATKASWEKILNNKESKKLLSSSWNTPNPQKSFTTNVKKIMKKYSGKKK